MKKSLIFATVVLLALAVITLLMSQPVSQVAKKSDLPTATPCVPQLDPSCLPPTATPCPPRYELCPPTPCSPNQPGCVIATATPCPPRYELCATPTATPGCSPNNPICFPTATPCPPRDERCQTPYPS